MAAKEGSGTVLVGIDGSARGRRALTWALEEARMRGMRCVLLHAVDFGLAGASAALDQLCEAGQAILDRELAFARQSGVEVEGRVETDSAGHALIEASRDADLLVVGNRGRGGFTGMLLGSVSTACVHHAHCPVLVVRPIEVEDAGK